MNNLGAAVLKLFMLASGAIVGLYLAKVYDETQAKHAEEQAHHDKHRYAQGLPPIQQDER